MRVAIIDLGTNTFNLLIAEKHGTQIKKLYAKKLPAKLGATNIQSNYLSEEAIQRGLNCLQEFSVAIQQYSPDSVFAFATSAVRSATNGQEFVQRAFEHTGISINIISGDKEAELIYYGNQFALEIPVETALILDIGGGSNEFILCNKYGIQWKHSFNLGTFRLIQQFRPSYPISNATIVEMELYFDEILQPLFDASSKYPPQLLIGSSGSFDSFRAILELTAPQRVAENSTSFPISISEMEGIYKHICSLSLEEIANIPGIDEIRVEIITVATVFVWYIIKKLKLSKIQQSSFSLKEGVIFKLFNNIPV